MTLPIIIILNSIDDIETIKNTNSGFGMTIPKIMNRVSIREPGEPGCAICVDTGKVPEVGGW